MRVNKLLHTFIFLFFASSLVMGQQAEKTLVKSFNLQGNQVVALDLDAPVELKVWKNDLLRIQMTVALKNGSDAMLKSLIGIGRYNLRNSVAENEFRVFAPGMHKEVKVGGKVLEEIISYTVFAPENVLVKMPNQASSQVDDDNSSL